MYVYCKKSGSKDQTCGDSTEKYKRNQCCLSTITLLQIFYEVTPQNLDKIVTQERKELKQIQANIKVHREEHLLQIQKN